MIIKHNLKNVRFLGIMSGLGFFLILFAVEALVNYVHTADMVVDPQSANIACIINLLFGFFACGSTIYLNCKVRQLEVTEDKFIYRNIFGKEKEILKKDIVGIKHKDNMYYILMATDGKEFCTIEDNMVNANQLFNDEVDFLGLYENFILELQKQEDKFKQYLMKHIKYYEYLEMELIEEDRKIKKLFKLRFLAKKETEGYYSDFMKMKPFEYFIPFAGYDMVQKTGYFLQEGDYPKILKQIEKWILMMIEKKYFVRKK